MKLTKEQVEKLAELCRLKLSPEELERMTTQMGDILEYVAMLSELDTDGVPETSQVTGLSNVQREDRVENELCEDPTELLATSQLPKQENQIRIKRMM
jgi:aspartyl/glutamyl-tRNA(Asn/Gln) amidotransferase C subunit